MSASENRLRKQVFRRFSKKKNSCSQVSRCTSTKSCSSLLSILRADLAVHLVLAAVLPDCPFFDLLPLLQSVERVAYLSAIDEQLLGVSPRRNAVVFLLRLHFLQRRLCLLDRRDLLFEPIPDGLLRPQSVELVFQIVSLAISRF